MPGSQPSRPGTGARGDPHRRVTGQVQLDRRGARSASAGRSSQPPGSASATAAPIDGIQIWPDGHVARQRDPAGRIRCPPLRRGDRAGPPPVPRRRSVASSGAACDRSASSPARCCSSTSSEHTRAAISTSASSAGCSPRLGPLTSTMPSVRPVHGSVIGAAAQPHRACDSTKCSAPLMKNGSPRTRAVPIALVPTLPSVQAEPLDEAEAVGHPAYAGVAAAPEHPALGVGDHHQLARVDDRCEQLRRAGAPSAPARSWHAGARARSPATARSRRRPPGPARTAAIRRHDAAISPRGRTAASRRRTGPRPARPVPFAARRGPRGAPSAGDGERCNLLATLSRGAPRGVSCLTQRRGRTHHDPDHRARFRHRRRQPGSTGHAWLTRLRGRRCAPATSIVRPGCSPRPASGATSCRSPGTSRPSRTRTASPTCSAARSRPPTRAASRSRRSRPRRTA